MSENEPHKRLDDLTARHDEALERLENHEKKAKRDRWTTIVSLIGALGAGGGGGLAYIQDDADDESVKTTVATHVATSSVAIDAAATDIEALQTQQMVIREAIVKIQTTIEMLSRRRSDVREELHNVEDIINRIERRSDSRIKARQPIDAETVQRTKENLFGHDP